MADDDVVNTPGYYNMFGTIWITIGVTIALIITAWFSAKYSQIFLLAGSMGGLGGILHEFAQSGGRIVFIQKRGDGIYMGTLTGVGLGAIAGLLMIRGFLPPNTDINYSTVTYEAFTAGLALKGVVEALADKPADSPTNQPAPMTPAGQPGNTP